MKPSLPCLLASLLLVGCATHRSSQLSNTPPMEPIHVSEMKPEPEGELDQVVFLNPGDTFPLSISMDSPIVELAKTEVDLTARERIYIWLDTPDGLTRERLKQMNEEEQKAAFRGTRILLSPDGEEWVSLYNLKKLKKVFKIDRGMAAFGLNVSSKDGVSAYATLEGTRKE